MELADEASVDRCVHRLNGKLVPGSNPVSGNTHFQTSQHNSGHVIMSEHMNVVHEVHLR